MATRSRRRPFPQKPRRPERENERERETCLLSTPTRVVPTSLCVCFGLESPLWRRLSDAEKNARDAKLHERLEKKIAKLNNLRGEIKRVLNKGNSGSVQSSAICRNSLGFFPSVSVCRRRVSRDE